MNQFDLLIIGGGPGGYVAAIRGAQLGLSVACVEKESALGGTCLRIGCIPSKALLESSELYSEARHGFDKHGFSVGEVKLDLPTMLKRKTDVVSQMTKGVDFLLKKNKVTRLLGHGRLLGNGQVEVSSADGKTETVSAKNIILATGSKPAVLPGIELDGQIVGTSTEALAYDTVPQHLVVIGAGYIGLELGSVWHRLGAKVTMVEYLDRIAPGMDRELADEAQKIFAKQGLEFRLKHKVLSAKAENGKGVVVCEGHEPIIADKVLVAVGRVPNTEKLGLDVAGVATDKRGRVEVNDRFATNVPGIYAIGDVVGEPMLAHKATHEAKVAAEVIAGHKAAFDAKTIPSVAYTDPEIAWMGMSEAEAKTAGIEYDKAVFPWAASGRALGTAREEGLTKVLFDKKTKRILGAGIVGVNAGELIAEAVLALEMGADAEDIGLSIHPHPTLSETFAMAAEMAGGTITDLYVPRK